MTRRQKNMLTAADADCGLALARGQAGVTCRVCAGQNFKIGTIPNALVGSTRRFDRQEMLDQALALFKLAHEPDEEYLDRRIRAQTIGDWSLAMLKAQIS